MNITVYQKRESYVELLLSLGKWYYSQFCPGRVNASLSLSVHSPDTHLLTHSLPSPLSTIPTSYPYTQKSKQKFILFSSFYAKLLIFPSLFPNSFSGVERSTEKSCNEKAFSAHIKTYTCSCFLTFTTERDGVSESASLLTPFLGEVRGTSRSTSSLPWGKQNEHVL